MNHQPGQRLIKSLAEHMVENNPEPQRIVDEDDDHFTLTCKSIDSNVSGLTKDTLHTSSTLNRKGSFRTLKKNEECKKDGLEILDIFADEDAATNEMIKAAARAKKRKSKKEKSERHRRSPSPRSGKLPSSESSSPDSGKNDVIDEHFDYVSKDQNRLLSHQSEGTSSTSPMSIFEDSVESGEEKGFQTINKSRRASSSALDDSDNNENLKLGSSSMSAIEVGGGEKKEKKESSSSLPTSVEVSDRGEISRAICQTDLEERELLSLNTAGRASPLLLDDSEQTNLKLGCSVSTVEVADEHQNAKRRDKKEKKRSKSRKNGSRQSSSRSLRSRSSSSSRRTRSSSSDNQQSLRLDQHEIFDITLPTILDCDEAGNLEPVPTTIVSPTPNSNTTTSTRSKAGRSPPRVNSASCRVADAIVEHITSTLDDYVSSHSTSESARLINLLQGALDVALSKQHSAGTT